MTVSVQFIEGLNEEITKVSLRKRRNSDTKIVVLMFDRLKATESFRSFTNQINQISLKDEEGDITVVPSGIKFLSADESDFSQVECSFEVESESDFERVMRFLNRYGEANGFEFKSN